MRVISGKYRGKKLATLDSIGTRPTTDRVKENVFNLLPHIFNENCVVCDLFGGSGQVGIEFASRGAKEVYINELNEEAIKIIKSNISGVDADFKISNYDAFKFSQHIKVKFDFIYIDGPYDKYDISELLGTLKVNLKSSSIIIIETNHEYNNEFLGFEILKNKKYGKTRIWFLKEM